MTAGSATAPRQPRANAHVARALGLLTASMLRRMLREGLVLRSLVFPLALTAGTLVATLVVVSATAVPPVVAVPPGWSDPAIEQRLAGYGFRTEPFADPMAAVLDRDARAATDGRTLWASGWTTDGIVVEAALRERHGSRFVLEPVVGLPRAADLSWAGALLARLMGAVFALYGVVLGAGMVARDRDDGTLAAEFVLPLPRWLHGASRFVAASTVLAAFVTASLLVFDALIGVPAVAAAARHSVAACTTAVAVGLVSVGRSGLRGGFAGRLAAGLATSFGLYALGVASPALAPWVPIASLGEVRGGWWPLVVSALIGAGAVVWFERSNRS